MAAALRSGVIDLPRARVICAELATLNDEEAQGVVSQVMERAGTQTTGQLGARVRRLVLSVDPTSAKERYERGIEGRRVELSANPDGTANLIAYSLPAARANAAYHRLDHLALAARGSDDPRTWISCGPTSSWTWWTTAPVPAGVGSSTSGSTWPPWRS